MRDPTPASLAKPGLKLGSDRLLGKSKDKYTRYLDIHEDDKLDEEPVGELD